MYVIQEWLKWVAVVLSPPEFSEGLAELGVVQVWILIRQLPARGLSPNHEGVHGSLDVRLALDRAAAPRRHGHQGPVVTLQHLRHRVPDARREPLVLALQLRDHERRVAAGSGWGCRRVRVRLLRGHGAGRAGWTARRLRAGLILLLRHDDRFCSQTRDARIQLLQWGFPHPKSFRRCCSPSGSTEAHWWSAWRSARLWGASTRGWRAAPPADARWWTLHPWSAPIGSARFTK